jgi:thiol-disulfide isomerase/thioredoxin
MSPLKPPALQRPGHALAAWGLALLVSAAGAQTPVPNPAAATATASAKAASSAASASAAGAAAVFGGTALDGQPFTLRPDDGRVRVLMFWRTDCAVCLSKMPELRANAQGWRQQPFELVLVNTDPRRDDAQAYDRLRRELNAGHGPLRSAWLGDVRLPAAWLARGRLPLMLVIDRQGRVVQRHEGRVPAELWDEVADLLP